MREDWAQGWGVGGRVKAGVGEEKRRGQSLCQPRGFLEKGCPLQESCVGRNGNPTVLSHWLGSARKSVASAQRLRKSLKEQIAGPVS